MASSSFNKIIKRKNTQSHNSIPLSYKSQKCGHGHKEDNLNSNIFQAFYNRTAQTEGPGHSIKLGHQIRLLAEAATYRLKHYTALRLQQTATISVVEGKNPSTCINHMYGLGNETGRFQTMTKIDT